MSSLIKATIFATLSCCAVSGQIAPLKGPVSGIIYDAPSRSIRPVVGFPGSAYLGQALASGVERAFVAPDGSSALIIESGSVVLIRALRGPDQNRVTLTTTGETADLIAWASNSTAAMLYSASTRRLRRLDFRVPGLTAEPAVDLSHLEGELTCLVTNEDATRTLIGIRHPDMGGFFELAGGASPAMLHFTPAPGAAVFGSYGEIYAIDGSSRRVLRIEAPDYGGGVESISFAGENEPLSDPVGIALSRNGQRLFVVGGQDRAVRVYDLRSRTMISALALDVTPQCLAPLAATSSVFLLAPRATAEQPTWIMDGRLEASVFFVPAVE